MKRAHIEEFFRRLAEVNPAPETELDYITPYTLLVAVVLSAQATDVSVNKATGPLYAVADTPQAMVTLGEDALRGYIRTIGLFNTKAKNVIKLSQMLIDEHDGEVPSGRKELEALPGVGRKTASVVLNAAFGEATIAVDTHVFRVSNRTGLAPAKTANAVEDKLTRIVPDAWKKHAHHWLILHGRYVCTARKPNCPACAVSEFCRFKGKEV
ncbi:MAG: endonuclease III [Alphaproteobacteria bacterium]